MAQPGVSSSTGGGGTQVPPHLPNGPPGSVVSFTKLNSSSASLDCVNLRSSVSSSSSIVFSIREHNHTIGLRPSCSESACEHIRAT